MIDIQNIGSEYIGSTYRTNRGYNTCSYSTIKYFKLDIVNDNSTIDNVNNVLILFRNENEKNEIDEQLENKKKLLSNLYDNDKETLSKKLSYYKNRLQLYKNTVDVYAQNRGKDFDLGDFYGDDSTFQEYDEDIEDEEYESYGTVKEMLTNEYKLQNLSNFINNLLNPTSSEHIIKKRSSSSKK